MSTPTTRYRVRAHGYAIQFVNGTRGKTWQMVGDKDATTFEREHEAHTKAREHGMQPGTFTTEPVPN